MIRFSIITTAWLIITAITNAQDREDLIFFDDFSDNRNNWGTGTATEYAESISNGNYYFEHFREEKGWSTWNAIEINEARDFQIEARIQKISGIQNNGYGISFGRSDSDNEYIFMMSGNGHFKVNNYENGETKEIIPWTKSKFINQGNGAFNKMAVVKRDGKLTFFINDSLLSEKPFQMFHGNKFGFTIFHNQKIAIDYLRLSYLESAGNFKDIFYDGFIDNRYNWTTGTAAEYIQSISNGSYYFEHLRENMGWTASRAIEMNEADDFFIEARIHKISGIQDHGYGINFGRNNSDNEFVFMISGNGFFKVNQYENGERKEFIPWTKSAFINQGNGVTNTLSIKKSDEKIMFFVNGTLLSDKPFQKFYGNRMGFTIFNNQKIAVDYFYVATLDKNRKQEKFTYNLPPILNVTEIAFSETILDAEESADLSITISNSGPGNAEGVYVNLSGNLNGLSFPVKTTFPAIPANGGTKTVNIKISGGVELPTSEAILKIEVIEPNFKVKIQGKQLKFPTREFRKPELILAKYAVIENQSANPNNQVDLNEIIDLMFAVQNVGQGTAENVSVKIENAQKGVMLLGVVSGSQLVRKDPGFAFINTGKYENITYRYFVNSEFSENQLEFSVIVTERLGKYGFSIKKAFPINTKLEESGYIRTLATNDQTIPGKVIIEDIPDFVVDVDTEIPIASVRQENTYVLIIGNEDYKSKQTGLSIETNVDFAVNDATVFSIYCEKTLGIPKKHIKLLKNATAAEISQGLAWISNLAKVENGKAKLIFYYSGHGLPHEQTKEAYIIPVDVSGTSLDYAIKVADIYAKLAEHPSQQITVFFDACFSGGARNQGLVAMKGVRIKPKEDFISGRLVAFVSSTGNESSAVYREKHHGYFTYFLLKKLKESKGEANFEELSTYIKQSVGKETGLIGKIQTPEVNVSHLVEDEWKTWTLK